MALLCLRTTNSYVLVQTCGRPFLQELYCLLTIPLPTMSRFGNVSLPGLAVDPLPFHRMVKG